MFSPATKAETGHDENVTFQRVTDALGAQMANTLKGASLALYEGGRDFAAGRGIIIADTKFEFGTTRDSTLLVIDEVLTPDSSRFFHEPPPPLPPVVIAATSARYREAYRLITGRALEVAA